MHIHAWLGFLTNATGESMVGLLEQPESGNVDTLFECNANSLEHIHVEVLGEAVGAISASEVNKLLRKFSVAFSQSSNGKQAPQTFLLPEPLSLMTGVHLTSDITGSVTETTETAEVSSLEVALAGTEEGKISTTEAPPNIMFTQFKGSNAGACPENAGKTKVEFKVVTEWCEYKVKNDNQLEEVTYTDESEFEIAGCVFAGAPKFCVEFVAPVEKQCTQNLKLLAGAECFIKLEYKQRPTVRPNGITLSVKLKSPAGEEVIFRPKLILN
jgi:hypothetical protein